MSTNENSSSVTNVTQTTDLDSTQQTNGTPAAKKRKGKLGNEAVKEIQRFLTRRLIGVQMTLDKYKDALQNTDEITRAITMPQVRYFENYASAIKDLIGQSEKSDKLLDPVFQTTVEECLRSLLPSGNSSIQAASMPVSQDGGPPATETQDDKESSIGLPETTQTSIQARDHRLSTGSGKHAKRGGR